MKNKLLIILTGLMALMLTGCSLGGPDVSDIELDQDEFLEIMKEEGYEVDSATDYYSNDLSGFKEAFKIKETFKEIGLELAIAAKAKDKKNDKIVSSLALYLEVENINDAWFVYKTLTLGGEAVDLFGSHANESKIDVEYYFDDTHDKESGLCNLVIDGGFEGSRGEMGSGVGYVDVIWKENKLLVMAVTSEDKSIAQDEMESMCKDLEMEDYLFDFDVE